jgi:hypothetical protein
MARLWSFGLVVLLVFSRPAAADDERDTFFESTIRPVLVTRCERCHGDKKSQSGLRVDSRAALLKGGDRGPAVVLGDPERSLLIRAIRHADDDLKMPPDGKPLAESVAAAFAQWVAQGAAWPTSDQSKAVVWQRQSERHWSFARVKTPVPPLDLSSRSQNAIDAFVDARRRQAGLDAVRPAERRSLIRRVTFDLIGLPPSISEINEFLTDQSQLAFTKVVDRLLASPHYGERWGRRWMDVVRYADTAGDNADYPVPELVRYRDYIIEAFNRDKPYDEFVREQIAGDILAREQSPADYAESVVATGFLALSRRYATAPFELWHLTLEDTIDTTGRAFLGLTLRCARCHDHKFDPVSQRDYYALYGIFASTTFPFAGAEELHSKKTPRMNFVPLVERRVAEPKLKAYRERLAALEGEIKSLQAQKDPKARKLLAQLQTEHVRLVRTSLPLDLPGSYAVTEGTPVDAPLQRRGEPGSPGPVVPRGVPRLAFLDCAPAALVPSQSSGRLELARWLSRPENPLTARVMVNRIWQAHFGRGIVATPSNFGLRGEPPSHPALLDWLAARFVAGGWSVKSIQRSIVLSQTYQLSSDFDSAAAAVDPENRLLWRFPRLRLDAESIRDAMLAVSGNLDRARPGPHPFPPIETWHWTQHDAFRALYPSDHRTVYLMTQRLVKHPYLGLFDSPDTNSSTDRRTHSTVPLQALYLLNNPFVRASAAAFAARLEKHWKDPEARIERAYEAAWGRPPDESERVRSFVYLRAWSAASGGHDLTNDRDAWISFARILLTANEFLYID